MKKWPEKGVVPFDELVSPLKDVVSQLYGLDVLDDKAEYLGYEFTGKIAATCLQPDEQLSREGLEYAEEQGREPIDVILGIAVQLGFIQGQRDAERSISNIESFIDTSLENMKEKHFTAVDLYAAFEDGYQYGHENANEMDLYPYDFAMQRDKDWDASVTKRKIGKAESDE